MKLKLKQISNLKGSVRMPLLSPDAAEALLTLERDTDGLIYLDMWRDGIASLMAKRLNKTSGLPGYSSHNYGLSVDLDVTSILKQKMIRYEDLLYLLKRRGWYCFRRDGDPDKVNSNHFNFLGPQADRYLVKCSMDPTTWSNPTDQIIFERYNSFFQLPLQEVQEKLSRLGMFKGAVYGSSDLYTREAILSFQRAWDMIPNGFIDTALCRVLSFVTAEIDLIS